MFKKILVANRGAVAARIIRAARQMNIDCAVVYSEADADLPYVRQAQEKICIGAPAAADSYLNIDKILAAAQSVASTPSIQVMAFCRKMPSSLNACNAPGWCSLVRRPNGSTPWGIKPGHGN